MIYQKNIKKQLSPRFNSSEFDCPCNHCTTTLIDPQLIADLEDLRAMVGLPLLVSSGYRCEAHNIAIGGAKNSSHTNGRAADLVCSDMDKLYAACEKIFNAVGDGRKKGFVHVDTRSDKVRRWNY